MFCGDILTTLNALRRRPSLIQDEIQSSLYGDGYRPGRREPVIVRALTHSVAGRSVVLVEDIIDTGRTIRKIAAEMIACGAAKVTVVALCRRITRAASRSQERQFAKLARPLDQIFVAFKLAWPDFVIGYGLDAAGRYRQLDYLASFVPRAQGKAKKKPRARR